jgi:hypothetical protein
MITLTDVGQAQFSGTLTTLTSAKSIDKALYKVPGRATHWISYHTGGTAAIVNGEKLTGGTSNHICRLEKIIASNGTPGSGDSGIILVRDISGVFQAETLTGTSTGTVVIEQSIIPIRSWNPPKTMLITVETASVNILMNGLTPTHTSGTNLGMTLTSGQSMLIYGVENIANFKVIDSSDGSGAIVKYSINF